MLTLQERRARCQTLVRKYYAHVPSREAVLEATIRPLLAPTTMLLDAGCGSTAPLLTEYGKGARFSVGIDFDVPSQAPGPRIALAHGDLSALPFRDATFDLIVSRSVVEHLEDPATVFRQLARALKPDGHLVFTTPNKFYYSSLIAAAIPTAWRDAYMRRVFAVDGYDHFPVFYRANTRRAIHRVAREAGLRVARLQALRHFPFYFVFSPLLFRVGMAYDWLVSALRLDALQSTWVVVMERAR